MISLDEFTAPSKPRHPCSVDLALKALPDDDRPVFVEAMSLPVDQVTHARVIEMFARYDLKLGQQVGRHRRGLCGCKP